MTKTSEIFRAFVTASSGLAFSKTRSASYPTSMVPTSRSIPSQVAGYRAAEAKTSSGMCRGVFNR
ncbi:hypothetical protein [Spirosoma sp. KNUC1025]|uniref:hypothetical protein n=1 Tax=Spirosoma sp. KNUC1025 TaxID=2894082 RepID=UPI001E6442A6|nr:hypothetical protein [Spirosoma sp. KNUC1025]UFH57911.1 hypothetical protein LN737_31635 [Spirosoma sp. KNUC1025]